MSNSFANFAERWINDLFNKITKICTISMPVRCSQFVNSADKPSKLALWHLISSVNATTVNITKDAHDAKKPSIKKYTKRTLRRKNAYQQSLWQSRTDVLSVTWTLILESMDGRTTLYNKFAKIIQELDLCSTIILHFKRLLEGVDINFIILIPFHRNVGNVQFKRAEKCFKR